MADDFCKLATWNINSVRLRMPLVAKYLRERRPDVLCLQETKCRDSEFPHSAFRELGYDHIEIHGQKGYHGVAIVSRRPLNNTHRRDFCNKGDARHLGVCFEVGSRDVELHNFYVPAGGDEPDPSVNPKFEHKLAFFDELAEWARMHKSSTRDTIMVGDINVEKLTTAMRAGEWIDAMRKFVPETDKLYTWWSYRSPDWKKADKGRRLDHIWVSPSLANAVSSLEILKEARGWERPSDHVPVSVSVSG